MSTLNSDISNTGASVSFILNRVAFMLGSFLEHPVKEMAKRKRENRIRVAFIFSQFTAKITNNGKKTREKSKMCLNKCFKHLFNTRRLYTFASKHERKDGRLDNGTENCCSCEKNIHPKRICGDQDTGH